MQRAQAELLESCARDFGVEVQFGGDFICPADLWLSDAEAWATPWWGGGFGTLDEADAAQYGYLSLTGWRLGGRSRVLPQDRWQYVSAPGGGGLDDTTRENIQIVANGPMPDSTLGEIPVDSTGNPVPSGGCLGRVEDQIGGPVVTTWQLEADLGNLALTHPDVKAAIDSWAGCMEAEGYEFGMVSEPVETLTNAVLSMAEIDLAVADVQCTAESRWADFYYAVLADYQQQAIDRQPRRFQRSASV